MVPIFHLAFKKYLLKLSHQIQAAKTWEASGHPDGMKGDLGRKQCLGPLGKKGPFSQHSSSLGKT